MTSRIWAGYRDAAVRGPAPTVGAMRSRAGRRLRARLVEGHKYPIELTQPRPNAEVQGYFEGVRMAVPPIFGSVTALSPILDYLRPRRSPYLIPTAVIAFLVGRRLLGLDLAPNPSDFGMSEFLFYAPIIAIFALLAVLSLFYQDPTLSPTAAEEADGKFDDKVVDEIDSQLKFSRAMGVAVGAAALYYLLARYPHAMLHYPTVVLYAVVLLHLLTFIAYMALYNIREESPTAHAYFQIGALMSIALIVLTLAIPAVDTTNGPWGTRCSTTFDVAFEGRPVAPFTDANDNARDPTPKEIAAIPIASGSQQVELQGCSATAAQITEDDVGVYSDGFKITKATQVGPVSMSVDEHFIVAACFLAIWLLFEVFWLRFLSRVVRVSITVFDDAARKTTAAKARRRKPAA